MRTIVAAAAAIAFLAGCPCRVPSPPIHALVFFPVDDLAWGLDGGIGDAAQAIDAGAAVDGAAAEDASACEPAPDPEPTLAASPTTVHGTVVEVGSGCNPQGWLGRQSRYRDRACDFWVTVEDDCGKRHLLEGTNEDSVAMIHEGDIISVELRAFGWTTLSGRDQLIGEVTVRAADGSLLLFWLADGLGPTTTSGGVEIALGAEQCPGGCSYHYDLDVTYQGEHAELPYAQSKQVGDLLLQHLGAYSLAGPECLMGDSVLMAIAGHRASP